METKKKSKRRKSAPNPRSRLRTLTDDYNPLKERLKNTFYCVEADSFAYHQLWRDYAHDSRNRRFDNIVLQWQSCDGYRFEIGTFGEEPIMLTMMWSILDGKDVMFFRVDSLVSHFGMVRDWLRKNCPAFNRNRHVDAVNFHNCVDAIKRAGANDE